MATPITDHVRRALGRLLYQYGDKPRIVALVNALVVPVQELEDTLNDMANQVMLSQATGVTLDNIGTIVGLARTPGDSDDVYRRKIYAEIKVNTSDGNPEDAIQTFQLMTGASLVLLDEYPPAQALIESDYQFSDQADVDSLIGFVEKVLPAGVRCNGFVQFDPVNAFAFAGNLPGEGWGDSGNPSTGGFWADIKRRDTTFGFAGDDAGLAGFGSDADPLVGGRWPVPARVPYFLSASVPADGAQVVVQLVAAGLPPLLPRASGLTGFTVKVNSVVRTVTSAGIEFNTRAFLTLASVVHTGDTVTVEYAPGNVVDSQGLALVAFAAQPVTNGSTVP